MAGVLRQAVLLQRFQPLMIAGAQQVRALLHYGVGRPGFRVDDIGILKRFCHIIDLAEAAARSCGIAFCHFNHIRDQVVPFGVREGDIHSKTRHQADDPLRHREGFAIAWRVGPGHGDFFALQCLQRAEVFAQPGEIRHRLGRVVNVAL